MGFHHMSVLPNYPGKKLLMTKFRKAGKTRLSDLQGWKNRTACFAKPEYPILAVSE
jgi:hypothetical protein